MFIGAALVIIAIARVHPVHLMNADWAPGGRQPSDQANRLRLWVRTPAGCDRLHRPSPFIIITQPESWYSFYRPTKGEWLSRPRHCSKGVQHVPKAVYRSGCRDKHTTVRAEIRSWNLSLAPQSCTLSLDHRDTS